MESMFRAIKRIIDEHPDIRAYPIYMNLVVRETGTFKMVGMDKNIIYKDSKLLPKNKEQYRKNEL